MTTLTAVYDLKRAPITYDFVVFMVIVDCVRQLGGHDDIHLTIIADQFRRITPRDHLLEDPEKQWRVKNCILDNVELLPTITRVELCKTRPDRTYDFPEGTTPYTPAQLTRYVKAGADPKVLCAPASLWPPTGPYITLSLRQSWNFPARNVDHAEWFKFYEYLISKHHKVIVIPDMEDDLTKQDYKKYPWQIHLGASYDIRLRMALYEGAELNIASANGPAAMLFLSHCKVLQLDHRRGGVLSDEVLAGLNGFAPGGQYPWSGPDQRLVPKDSDFNTLVEEYETYLQA